MEPASHRNKSSTAVADRLNERFETGGRHEVDSLLGVLIHQFDANDSDEPESQWWLQPSSLFRKRNPGRRPDSMHGSLVNARMTRDPGGMLPLFSAVLGGIVLSPERAATRCMYISDSLTNMDRRHCGTARPGTICIPGCISKVNRRAPPVTVWCDENSLGDCHGPWPPGKMPAFMEAWHRRRVANKTRPCQRCKDHFFNEVRRVEPWCPGCLHPRPHLLASTHAQASLTSPRL